MRRWPAATGLAFALLLGGASAASATGPVPLDSAPVTDVADVLGGADEQAANELLDELRQDPGTPDLRVVFVDEFSSPADAVDWADETAVNNDLAPDEYLLAVATEAGQYAMSFDSSGPLSEDRVVEIENAVLPDLENRDWLAAVQTAADELAGGSGDAGGGVLTIVLLVIVVIVAIVLAIVLLRRRRRRTGGGTARAPAEPAEPIEELRTRAATTLVAADDAVRTSEQELGFAHAQFGAQAAEPFEAAIQSAKERLGRAFQLQQRLDDASESDEAAERAALNEIIELGEHASDELEERAAAFEELRKLEQNAPEALAAAQERRAHAAAEIDAAAAALASLSERYAAEALESVADNPDQARSRLEFADAQLTEAQRHIGAGSGGEAAVSIRAGEQAVAQALALEKQIDTLSAALSDGEERAAALISDLEADIAAARTLPDPEGRVAAAIAATEEHLEHARQNLAGTRRRPLMVLQNLQNADTRIDGVVAGVRAEQERNARARRTLDQTLHQARAELTGAEDFIASRRGAVGATARTRLADARARLASAESLQTSDPAQALDQANRALQLARGALSAAQRDMSGFSAGGYGGRGSGIGGDIVGGIVGGLIAGAIGGGRRRGGFGGAFSGGRRGRSFGGGRRGGSFGGSFGGGRRGGSFGGGRRGGSFGGGRRGGGRF